MALSGCPTTNGSGFPMTTLNRKANTISNDLPLFFMSFINTTLRVNRIYDSIGMFLGLIHQPTQICAQDLLDELDFWGVDPSPALAPCCCSPEHDEDDHCGHLPHSDKKPDSLSAFKRLPFGEIRFKLWQIMEQPSRLEAPRG